MASSALSGNSAFFLDMGDSGDCLAAGTEWKERSSSIYCTAEAVADWRTTNFISAIGREGDIILDPVGKEEYVCVSRPYGALDGGFYFYETYFTDIKLKFPFSDFQCEIMRVLNVAPSQIHPNGWGYIKAFEVLCKGCHIRPSASLFFCFHIAKTRGRGSYLYFASVADGLFRAHTQSYKGYKEKFFRVRMKDEGVDFTKDLDGNAKFPLYWQESPFYISGVRYGSLTDYEKESIALLKTIRRCSCRTFISAEHDSKSLENAICSLSTMDDRTIRALLKKNRTRKAVVEGEGGAVSGFEVLIGCEKSKKSSAKKKDVRKRTRAHSDSLLSAGAILGSSSKAARLDEVQVTPTQEALPREEGVEDIEAGEQWFKLMRMLELEIRKINHTRRVGVTDLEDLRKQMENLKISSSNEVTELEGKLTAVTKAKEVLQKEKDSAVKTASSWKALADQRFDNMEALSKRVGELEADILKRYEDGFEAALAQFKVAYPTVKLDVFDPSKTVKDGKIVGSSSEDEGSVETDSEEEETDEDSEEEEEKAPEGKAMPQQKEVPVHVSAVKQGGAVKGNVASKGGSDVGSVKQEKQAGDATSGKLEV